MIDFDEHKQVFREEMYEILSEIESAILDLENNYDNLEIIEQIYRAIHTINGISNMFDFYKVESFTLKIEEIFNSLIDGDISITPELISIILIAKDHLRLMFDSLDGSININEEKTREIILSLENLLPSNNIETKDKIVDLMDIKFEPDEVYDLLSEIETILLDLEQNMKDEELIGALFRAIHTVKGLLNMFGFDHIGSFCHEIETVLDYVRDGILPVNKELIVLILSATDQIKIMINTSLKGEPFDKNKIENIISSLKVLIPENEIKEIKKPLIVEKQVEVKAEKEPATYKIQFIPSPDIIKRINPVDLFEDLRKLGDARVIARVEAVPELNDYIPDYCYTYWDILLTSTHDINAVRDTFIFVEDISEINIEIVEPEKISPVINQEEVTSFIPGVLEHPITRSVSKKEEIFPVKEPISSATSKSPDQSVKVRPIDQEKKRQAIEKESKKASTGDSMASIRVPSHKLDSLVDLVGELVTVQARLLQYSSDKDEPELLAISEDVERLTNKLRDNTLNIRMLPIGTTFGKFKRLVRDLSKDLGKDIEMTTEGAETELDKTVIERLGDPLVHLIRNSIDHGIEMPDERETVGKMRQGTIHLSASYSGANVLIQIKDDGKGLDREAIYAKSVDRGLISPNAELSEKELFSMIFHPGFSTAKQVTSVSGRGVGMDVVKRCIDGLRGTIEIASRKGFGTTITLKLPLTLAIIEGLLVIIKDDYFVLPLSSVEECIELTREDIAKVHGRHIVNVRGEIIPYVRLREFFGIQSELPVIEQIVITQVDGFRVGFVVDQVIGEYQTVLKNLGSVYRNIKGMSGATILGNGTVALIIDVPELLREAEVEEGDLIL